MAYETIEVEPLSPNIGAEIFGVDLSQPLGNQTFSLWEKVELVEAGHFVVCWCSSALKGHCGWSDFVAESAIALRVTTRVCGCRSRANFGCLRFGC